MPTSVTIVDRLALKKAVDYVTQVAGSKTPLPILKGIRIDASDETGLSVTCTDLNVTLTETVDGPNRTLRVVGPEPTAAVVSAAAFKRTVAAIPGETLTVTLPGDGTAVLAAGAHTLTLDGMPVTDWPREPHPIADPFNLTAHTIAAFRRVAPFASRDDARPILTGILVESETVVTTDSYRLAFHTVDQPEVTAPFLFPARVVKYLPKNADVVARVGNWCFSWSVGKQHGVARLIEGRFPDWRLLVPTATACKATFDRKLALDGLKPLQAAIGNRSDILPLRFVANENADGLIVSAVERGVATGTFRLPATVEGVWPSCAFNSVFFKEALAAFSAPTVTVGTNDALKPALIEDDGLGVLLMPVRVG
jgi:DNA polymerase-3 subunit beta